MFNVRINHTKPTVKRRIAINDNIILLPIHIKRAKMSIEDLFSIILLVPSF